MLRIGATAALCALALCLSACGGKPPAAAVEAARKLLAAAQAGDRVAFEAVIDRQALREDLRRQMAEVARESALDVDGGPSEFALDRIIGPTAVRVVRAEASVEPPTQEDVARRMKLVGRGRACLTDGGLAGKCLLTFAKGKPGWRLVGMQALDVEVQLAGLAS